jgi:hypothetical protein
MNIDEAVQHWRERLFLAREQLAADPLNSVEWQRDVVSEIESALESHPEQRARIEPVLVQARAALRDGERASTRFVDDSAGRAKRMHAYEAARAHVPIRLLRRPWPPIDRSGSSQDAGSS